MDIKVDLFACQHIADGAHITGDHGVFVAEDRVGHLCAECLKAEGSKHGAAGDGTVFTVLFDKCETLDCLDKLQAAIEQLWKPLLIKRLLTGGVS